MSKKTIYEWDLETVDGHGDIEDHSHSDLLAPLWKWREGKNLVLVKDVFYDGSLEERSWAYVKDGKLPENFSDAYGRNFGKVPARFHIELAKIQA